MLVFVPVEMILEAVERREAMSAWMVESSMAFRVSACPLEWHAHARSCRGASGLQLQIAQCAAWWSWQTRRSTSRPLIDVVVKELRSKSKPRWGVSPLAGSNDKAERNQCLLSQSRSTSMLDVA